MSSKRWYIVHAYSGFEKQVMRSLQERIKRTEMEHFFGDVLVPLKKLSKLKTVSNARVNVNSFRAMC